MLEESETDSAEEPLLLNPVSSGVRVLIFFCLCALNVQIRAEEISGTARVIDGDTIALGSQVIRLYGIDAPENAQDCQRGNGQTYNCGAVAESALKALLTQRVSCSGTEHDRYRRLIGTCTSGGVDVSRRLVSTGNALAYRKYSTRYVADEQIAASAKLGMWAGSFTAPWDFRSGKWQAAAQVAPTADCPIKGNINRAGERIYHTPWSRSYSRTRIDTKKSERWFCSESQALAAGWRAAYK